MMTESAISRASLSRLPYLKELGVDAIWLSPIFPSPMRDFGYDISAYTDIDPIFGYLADFDTLIAAAHGCGLKVLLDLVPNHTSDQHPWFVESRLRAITQSAIGISGMIPRRMAGRPTTGSRNLGAVRGSSINATGQYYYHAFLREQPDLNWRNPRRAGGHARRHAVLA